MYFAPPLHNIFLSLSPARKESAGVSFFTVYEEKSGFMYVMQGMCSFVQGAETSAAIGSIIPYREPLSA